jgi:3-phenylpropionate/trans-cinnamate dioxygenase ferredoxin reductase subunit
LTASEKELPCDFAVVGIGVVPATEWLDGSGIALANGVLVDEFCETNVPGIYAAGDVANSWHPLVAERLRVEHETNAQIQGVTAARNMLGRRTPYAAVPFVWSDQYDLQIHYVGHAHGDDHVVLRGDPASGSFLAAYLRDGAVRAALGVNRSEDVDGIRGLMQSGTVITADQILNEDVNLGALAAESA